MCSTVERFDLVEESATFFERRAGESCESWKQDHAIAMLCFDFAELFYQGVNLYDSICRLDNDWRVYVYRNEIPYDAAFERRIEGIFAKWVVASEGVLKLYDQVLKDEYAGRGFDFSVVEDLRRHCREVRMSMGDDELFFARESTFQLADNAHKEYEAGTTTDMEKLERTQAE